MTQLAQFENTADDSDKTFTVPTGKEWIMEWIHIILITTATAGNRQIVIEVKDESAQLMYDLHAGAVQAASLTRHYMALPGIYRETAFVDGQIQMALPQKMVLKPGWTIRMYDSAAVDAAADDMTVSFGYEERLAIRDL